MITLGTFAHERTHTVWCGRRRQRRPATRNKDYDATTTADNLALIAWADEFGAERRSAVENFRHLSRRLERDMLAAGERIVRLPLKLVAHARDSARTYGESDPIDALARAALREPSLSTAHLDVASRELRWVDLR